MKIWVCEDLDVPKYSYFGKTKESVENKAIENYGAFFPDIVADGWVKEPVEIEVPDIVGIALLELNWSDAHAILSKKFIEHLEQSSEIVQNWPIWKQKVIQ